MLYALLFFQAFAITKVFVIDTGLSDANLQTIPYVKYYEDATEDHGAVVASIIVHGDLDSKDTVCPIELSMCRFVDSTERYHRCLKMAADGDYDLVNMSLSGPDYSEEEYRLVAAIAKKSLVIISAGNLGKDYRRFYPGGYNQKIKENLYTIGNMSNRSSNWGPGLIWVDGNNIKGYSTDNTIVSKTGTSMSAALYSHKLIKMMCEDK